MNGEELITQLKDHQIVSMKHLSTILTVFLSVTALSPQPLESAHRQKLANLVRSSCLLVLNSLAL
jgi:hypothetical protein